MAIRITQICWGPIGLGGVSVSVLQGGRGPASRLTDPGGEQAPSGTTVLRAPAKSAVCGVTMAAEKKDAGLTRRAALGLAPALAGLVFAKVLPPMMTAVGRITCPAS